MNTPIKTYPTIIEFEEYNKCVVCGKVVPEGIMVCPSCEKEMITPPTENKKTYKPNNRNIKKTCWLLVFWNFLFSKSKHA